MKNLLQRIEQIAHNEGITVTALETKIGASKGVISKALNRGTDIQSKWISALAENYPRYNTYWLLTGNGPMEIKNSDFIKKDLESRMDSLIRIIEKQQETIHFLTTNRDESDRRSA